VTIGLPGAPPGGGAPPAGGVAPPAGVVAPGAGVVAPPAGGAVVGSAPLPLSPSAPVKKKK